MNWLKKIAQISNNYPRTFYRGTVPGETKRIDEPFESAKGKTFVARKKETALSYGSSIEEIRAKPYAKILYYEQPEFWKILGKRRPPNSFLGSVGMSLVDAVNTIIGKAQSFGYDAISLQDNVVTIILNEEAFDRGPS